MFEILSIVLKKWKLILGITVVITVVTALASLLLPNYYTSTVVFQPANPGSFNRSAVFPVEGSDAKTSMFGSSKDADRVISLGSSRKLYDYLIEKYSLFTHYEIEPTEQYAFYKVTEKLKDNYVIKKNANSALEIEVTDKQPQFAATMANDIYATIDSFNREIIFKKKHEIVSILEKQHTQLKQKTEMLRDSMQNILNRNANDTIRANYIDKILTKSVSEYANVTTNLDQNKAILNLNQSTLHLFEAASVADRKSSPKRSLIVIGAAIFSLLIMIITALFSEKFAQYQEEINQ